VINTDYSVGVVKPYEKVNIMEPDFDGNKPGNGHRDDSYTYRYQNGENPSLNVTETRFYTVGSRVRSVNVSIPPYLTLPNSAKTIKFRRPSSFSRSITTYTAEPITGTVKYSDSRTDSYETSTAEFINGAFLNEFLPVCQDSTPVADYPYDDYARAVTECLNKLGNMKVNMAENLATARQTVNLIAEDAAHVWKTLLNIKRGNWAGIPSSLGLSRPRDLGRNLLKFRYGYKPLLGDLYQIFEDFRKKDPDSYVISAFRGINGSKEYEDTFYIGSRKCEVKTKSEYRTVCKLFAHLSSDWLATGNQYGLVNPAVLAWELVPWSFVLDWTLPVGNFLQAYSDTAGLNFIGGYTSVRMSGNKTALLSPPPFPSDSWNSATHSSRRFSFRRDALGDFPTPLPYVKSPFSTTHVENALALLANCLKLR